jgi:DNA-binding transcriptional LysR family regulator
METVLNGANTLLHGNEVNLSISPFSYDKGFTEDLCEIEFVAAAHPSHPLHQLGRKITHEDLRFHRQIVVRDSSTERKGEVGWLGAEQRWTVSHIRTSIDIISQGLGFAWLPTAIIHNHLAQQTLAPLPLENGGKRKALMYLSFNNSESLGPAARAFIGELRAQTMDLNSNNH